MPPLQQGAQHPSSAWRLVVVGNTVYTHCMRRFAAAILLCFLGTSLPSATVFALSAPQQLLPVCCRTHGAHACVMSSTALASPDTGPTLRQPACPFSQALRAITTVTLSADFTQRVNLGLPAIGMTQAGFTSAVLFRFPRLSAPRGPPSLL